MAQAVQILKQTPEGSCKGLLDSPEHTDFSLLATRKPLLPLASCRTWRCGIALEAERSEGSRQRPPKHIFYTGMGMHDYNIIIWHVEERG